MKEGLTIGQLSEINAELHTEIAALKKQRDALAVENAGMKSVAQSVYDEMESHHDTDGLFCYDADGEPMDALLRLCDAQSTVEVLLLKYETPATDDAIAKIQAQGVDIFVAHIDYPHSPVDFTHGYVDELAKAFASKLRKDPAHD